MTPTTRSKSAPSSPAQHAQSDDEEYDQLATSPPRGTKASTFAQANDEPPVPSPPPLPHSRFQHVERPANSRFIIELSPSPSNSLSEQTDEHWPNAWEEALVEYLASNGALHAWALHGPTPSDVASALLASFLPGLQADVVYRKAEVMRDLVKVFRGNLTPHGLCTPTTSWTPDSVNARWLVDFNKRWGRQECKWLVMWNDRLHVSVLNKTDMPTSSGPPVMPTAQAYDSSAPVASGSRAVLAPSTTSQALPNSVSTLRFGRPAPKPKAKASTKRDSEAAGLPGRQIFNAQSTTSPSKRRARGSLKQAEVSTSGVAAPYVSPTSFSPSLPPSQPEVSAACLASQQELQHARATLELQHQAILAQDNELRHQRQTLSSQAERIRRDAVEARKTTTALNMIHSQLESMRAYISQFT